MSLMFGAVRHTFNGAVQLCLGPKSDILDLSLCYLGGVPYVTDEKPTDNESHLASSETYAQGALLERAWAMSFYTIKDAIRGSWCLKLSLADDDHIVEPHLLGRNLRGATSLRTYQVRGPHNEAKKGFWKLIRLDLIRHAVETGSRFARRSGYKPNDRAMTGGTAERL